MPSVVIRANAIFFVVEKVILSGCMNDTAKIVSISHQIVIGHKYCKNLGCET